MANFQINSTIANKRILTEDDLANLVRYEALILLLKQKGIITEEELDDFINVIKVTDKLEKL